MNVVGTFFVHRHGWSFYSVGSAFAHARWKLAALVKPHGEWMMVDDKTAIEGSCLCNAVRFRVIGPIRAVVGCHCGQCRKQTGHYMPATGTLLKFFSLVEDRGLKWYAASDLAKRGFCAECGSTLFWQANDADRIAIAAGSIDGVTCVNTVAHIFVEDKGDYYQLDENLPQFPQGDAGIPWPE